MKKLLFALFALVALFALGSCHDNSKKHQHEHHDHHHHHGKVMHFHHLKNEYKVGDELKVEAHSFKKEIKEYHWYLKLKDGKTEEFKEITKDFTLKLEEKHIGAELHVEALDSAKKVIDKAHKALNIKAKETKQTYNFALKQRLIFA